MSEQAAVPTTSRLLAKVIWELLKAEQFETLADLVDAVKTRCARLHIRYDNDDINAALTLVGSNTELTVRRPPPPPPPDPPPPIGRTEAAQIVAALPARPAIKTIADARILSHAFVDKVKALRMVMDELEAAEARCDALENEPPA